MKLLVLALTALVALSSVSLDAAAQASRPRVVENPWDVTARSRMENDGWTFASTFGITERMCYAMPPGGKWAEGNFGDEAVRNASIAAGAIRFAPRSVDGKCHADDAKVKVKPKP